MAKKKTIIEVPAIEELKDQDIEVSLTEPREAKITPYRDEDLDNEEEYNKLLRFFNQTSSINFDEILKNSYPNNIDFINVPGQRDTAKWINTIKELYIKEKNGLTRMSAIRQLTSNWDIMEINSFLNWMKFYEEGAHLKYKTAQVWYANDSPGYFLKINPDKEKEENNINIEQIKKDVEDEMPISEKKEIIEKQRSKLLSRLDSTKKILRSNEGRLFAGPELSNLLKAIHQLEEQIHTLKNASKKMCDDLIIRKANVLAKNGFIKSSNYLYALANGDPNPIPTTTPPAPPTEVSGAVGGLPAVGTPGQTNPPALNPNNTPAPNQINNVPTPNKNNAPKKGIKDFKKNIEDDILDIEDDVLEVEDEDNLVVEAQMEPPMEDPIKAPTELPMDKPSALPPPAPLSKPDKLNNEPIEVNEDDKIETKPSKDFDKMIDGVFDNITVDDIVNELDQVAQIFKSREIPRRLAIIDLAMNKLQISSFFAELSEASNKSLESNNYILTRIEAVLSKLRGAMKTKEIDLTEKNTPVSPEISKLKGNLQQQEDKEKNRKQLRKDIEQKELQEKTDLSEKETPEINMEEELKEPAPEPTKPIAPKPVG